MHEHGLGVAKNTKTATAFYNKALSAGSAEAAKKIK
jgi:TPR repeat protein